jgi:hypothetical protein
MLDWNKTKQEPSGERCVKCASRMYRILGAKDSKGKDYDGLVCHECKTVIWIRKN